MKLAYDDSGGEGPAVVMVHGWGTDRRALKSVYDELKAKYRVLSLDLPGHGRSPAPHGDDGYTVKALAVEVQQLMGACQLERPLILGHSFGGYVASQVAAERGGDVAGVVVLESHLVAPRDNLRALRPVVEGLRGPGAQDVAASVMQQLVGPLAGPALQSEMLDGVGQVGPEALAGVMAELIEFDSAAAVRELKCPVLYVGTGAPYADLVALRELCPQLQTAELLACGHYFPLEVPEQLLPIIARFLAVGYEGKSLFSA